MAEVLVKIGSGARYDDGDIVGVANWRSIRNEHASRICSRYDPAYRNSEGLIILDSLADKWFQHTHQYRYERVSRSEVNRLNQWTSDTTLVSAIPVPDPDRPGRLIWSSVKSFFARRLANPNHIVCGNIGSEVYYGGLTDYSNSALNSLWAEINTQTGLVDTDFPHVPLSQVQLKHMLVLPVDDFSDEVAVELTSSLLDGAGEIVKKRKHHIKWRDLFPLTIPPETKVGDVLDRRRPVDPRPRAAGPFQRANIVERKTAV